MNALPSAAIVALLSLVALPAQSAAAFNITATDCLSSFIGLNLDLNDFARFPEYFHEASTLQLAQAGVYTGPAAIEEYIKFANVQNPAVEARTDLNQTFALTAVDTEAGVCEFLLTVHIHYVFSEIISNATADVALSYRLFLNTTSLKLDKVNVLLEDEYLHWVAAMFSLPNAQAWVCNAMEHSCNETWSFNGLVDQPDCMSRLAALPSSTGESGSFDGNSQSCRFLHGVLAEFNEDHCPHISFLPQEDKKGELRCQTSQNVTSTDLFTAEQRAFFELFKAENRLPASGFIPRVPCGSSNHQRCPDRYTCDTMESMCVVSQATSTTSDGQSGSSTSRSGSNDHGMTSEAATESTTTSSHYESDGSSTAALGSAALLVVLALLFV